MKERKLKIWNGRTNDCKGHLYVAAYSQKDCVDIANAAYRKLKGWEDRPDIAPYALNEIRNYWSPDCWGTPMDGIAPERGVWMVEDGGKVPRRIL